MLEYFFLQFLNMSKSLRFGQWHCQDPKGTTSPACAPTALGSPKSDQGPGPHFNSSRALPHHDQGPGPWTVNLCPRNVTAEPASSLPTALPCLATGPFPTPWRHWMPGTRAGDAWGWGCLSSGYPAGATLGFLLTHPLLHPDSYSIKLPVLFEPCHGITSHLYHSVWH